MSESQDSDSDEYEPTDAQQRAFSRTNLPNGSALFAFNDNDLKSTVEQKLKKQTETPTPSDGEGKSKSAGTGSKPITRFNDLFSIGSSTLEAVGLNGGESAENVRTRRDELYRNEFPVWLPRFTLKCTDCGTEFDTELEECNFCASTDLRRPDPAEKKEAERMSEQVNKEGQSLRSLARYAEPDQWFQGVSVLVLKHKYTIAGDDSRFFRRGQIIDAEVDEIIKGDPKRIKPIADENGRIGGKWICPVHRDQEADSAGHVCSKCGAKMQEAFYAEAGNANDPENYYLDNEIVDWAYPYPKFHGRDGLAPMHHVWVQQAILDFMRSYVAAFYDPDSDRLPRQIMILHTTNPDNWERQLKEARDGAKEDPYDAPIFTNEYSSENSSAPEAQVINVMPDELLGQSSEIKKQYQKEIRRAIGNTDVQDSDLEEAGGLNNEGMQLEVTDRSIASQQLEYTKGWLDTLAKRMGIDDWFPAFRSPQESEVDDLREQIRLGKEAYEAGLDATYEDGQTDVKDGEFEVQQEPQGFGGAGGFAPPEDDDDIVSQADEPPDAVDAVETKADAATNVLTQAFRHIVWAEDGTEQKSTSFFSQSDRVPEFVLELVNEAIANGAVYSVFETIKQSQRSTLIEIFRERLSQPQGWSLESLQRHIEDALDISSNDARFLARDVSADILNTAREIGYKKQGSLDERVFYWAGPQNEDTTDVCRRMKEETNPRFGGTPRPLNELQAMLHEIAREEGHDPRGWKAHYQERHTFFESVQERGD